MIPRSQRFGKPGISDKLARLFAYLIVIEVIVLAAVCEFWPGIHQWIARGM